MAKKKTAARTQAEAEQQAEVHGGKRWEDEASFVHDGGRLYATLKDAVKAIVAQRIASQQGKAKPAWKYFGPQVVAWVAADSGWDLDAARSDQEESTEQQEARSAFASASSALAEHASRLGLETSAATLLRLADALRLVRRLPSFDAALEEARDAVRIIAYRETASAPTDEQELAELGTAERAVLVALLATRLNREGMENHGGASYKLVRKSLIDRRLVRACGSGSTQRGLYELTEHGRALAELERAAQRRAQR